MFAPKHILVPTDFSKFSDKARKEAIDIAKQHGSTIHLLLVINIVEKCTVDYCLDKTMVVAFGKQITESAKKRMAEETDKLPESKEVKIIPEVRKGTPYEEILKVEKDKKIDLVVIASHGTTGLLHYFIDSVTEKVTKGAKCPVLLIRG